jgi:hypothetical protein
MDAKEFKEITDALGLKAGKLGKLLFRSPVVIARYRSGKNPIPDSVAFRVKQIKDAMNKIERGE